MSFLHHLYKALATPGGIVIQSNDPEKLRMKLYAERRAANNPDLDLLTISLSRTNPTGELWIMNRSKVGAEEVDDPS